MTAWYNEKDPFAAQWLRNLIHAGHIAQGDVDERSIVDVRPNDLIGYTQCHFFAGIGVWSYALRKAGWEDARGVWTVSCPCQPFSDAGRGLGFADERHLWPAFHWLIEKRRPGVIMGEQVATKDGFAWLDLVQDDLEGSGYASGALDICSAGFGAPMRRQRIVFVAVEERQLILPIGGGQLSRHIGSDASGRYEIGWVADRTEPGWESRRRNGIAGAKYTPVELGRLRQARGLASRANGPNEVVKSHPGPTNGFWRNADWLKCLDDIWRPVESGAFPLVNGASGRVGRLRAYGNAINAEATSEAIKSFMECCP